MAFDPMSPDTLQLVLTTKLQVRIEFLKKKQYIYRHISQIESIFLSAWFYFLIAQGQYRDQIRFTRILDSKPLINIDYWIGDFSSVCIAQLINLRKVRNKILKFRTDLQEQVEPFQSHFLLSVLYRATKWNIFSSQIFCSMLVKQVIDLKKVRTEDRSSCQFFYWWLINITVKDYFH